MGWLRRSDSHDDDVTEKGTVTWNVAVGVEGGNYGMIKRLLVVMGLLIGCSSQWTTTASIAAVLLIGMPSFTGVVMVEAQPSDARGGDALNTTEDHRITSDCLRGIFIAEFTREKTIPNDDRELAKQLQMPLQGGTLLLRLASYDDDTDETYVQYYYQYKSGSGLKYTHCQVVYLRYDSEERFEVIREVNEVYTDAQGQQGSRNIGTEKRRSTALGMNRWYQTTNYEGYQLDLYGNVWRNNKLHTSLGRGKFSYCGIQYVGGAVSDGSTAEVLNPTVRIDTLPLDVPELTTGKYDGDRGNDIEGSRRTVSMCLESIYTAITEFKDQTIQADDRFMSISMKMPFDDGSLLMRLASFDQTTGYTTIKYYYQFKRENIKNTKFYVHCKVVYERYEIQAAMNVKYELDELDSLGDTPEIKRKKKDFRNDMWYKNTNFAHYSMDEFGNFWENNTIYSKTGIESARFSYHGIKSIGGAKYGSYDNSPAVKVTEDNPLLPRFKWAYYPPVRSFYSDSDDSDDDSDDDDDDDDDD
eukprot:Lankesteria_metandrocarpae@DN4526_c0_g1_i1.p1